MEDFKKNLLKMGKTNRTVPAVLLIAAAFFLLFGIFLIPHKDQPFDPTSGGYASCFPQYRLCYGTLRRANL